MKIDLWNCILIFEIILLYQTSAEEDSSLVTICEQIVSGVVFMELSNSIYREEAHIVSIAKGNMAEMIFFLEDNLVSKLFREPGNISRSSKLINIT